MWDIQRCFWPLFYYNFTIISTTTVATTTSSVAAATTVSRKYQGSTIYQRFLGALYK